MLHKSPAAWIYLSTQQGLAGGRNVKHLLYKVLTPRIHICDMFVGSGMVFSLPRGQMPRPSSEGMASPRWILPAKWALKLTNTGFCPGMLSRQEHRLTQANRVRTIAESPDEGAALFSLEVLSASESRSSCLSSIPCEEVSLSAGDIMMQLDSANAFARYIDEPYAGASAFLQASRLKRAASGGGDPGRGQAAECLLQHRSSPIAASLPHLSAEGDRITMSD